jgi:hypothetical protein
MTGQSGGNGPSILLIVVIALAAVVVAAQAAGVKVTAVVHNLHESVRPK